jgi:hypothetical protein
MNNHNIWYAILGVLGSTILPMLLAYRSANDKVFTTFFLFELFICGVLCFQIAIDQELFNSIAKDIKDDERFGPDYVRDQKAKQEEFRQRLQAKKVWFLFIFVVLLATIWLYLANRG